MVKKCQLLIVNITNYLVIINYWKTQLLYCELFDDKSAGFLNTYQKLTKSKTLFASLELFNQ
jgi:hypothetical protein